MPVTNASLLVATALLSLASVSITAILRALFRLATVQGRKPIACDVCMSFWTAVFASSGAIWILKLSWACLVFSLPVAGLTLLLLTWYGSVAPAAPPVLFPKGPDA